MNRKEFTLSQIEKYGEATFCLNDKQIEDFFGKRIIIGKGFNSGVNWIRQHLFSPHGFGYEMIDGKWTHIPHSGKIIIGKNVTIHEFTVICPGTGDDDETIIGDGTKIDTRCHIAHNVKIGKDCLITSGVTIGGSAEISDGVYIGIGALIRNKIKIGKGAVIGMGAVVVSDVEPFTTVIGNPARPYDKRSNSNP